MRKTLAFLGISTLVSAAAWMGCGGDDTEATNAATTTGSGGATSSTVTVGPSSVASSTSASTGGSAGTCSNAPDGVCDVDAAEDCDCEDCAPTALCSEHYCKEDGDCNLVTDSCVCADCDTDFICADPGHYNCVDDGVCDTLSYYEGGGEGCNCPDCFGEPECMDNQMACNGGMSDGACDPGEDCLCSDCLGTAACVTCNRDMECSASDACFCTDCLEDMFCTRPSNCMNDGICAPLYEACTCADCDGKIPQCGGTGGGGGGGAGGTGGTGGASTGGAGGVSAGGAGGMSAGGAGGMGGAGGN